VLTWLVRPSVTALFVLLLSLPAAGSTAVPQEPRSLPANLHVDDFYQPVVARLLDRSETFAAQCRRIAAAPHVRVAIVATSASRTTMEPRARSRITRHLHGAIRAVVEIPVDGDHAELIGHELEHVVEQIEGLDLAALARSGAPGVAEIQTGVYETRRARLAGLAVADEARGADPVYAVASRGVGVAIRALRTRASRSAPTLLRR
jgi:hypothetical protein